MKHRYRQTSKCQSFMTSSWTEQISLQACKYKIQKYNYQNSSLMRSWTRTDQVTRQLRPLLWRQNAKEGVKPSPQWQKSAINQSGAFQEPKSPKTHANSQISPKKSQVQGIPYPYPGVLGKLGPKHSGPTFHLRNRELGRRPNTKWTQGSTFWGPTVHPKKMSEAQFTLNCIRIIDCKNSLQS